MRYSGSQSSPIVGWIGWGILLALAAGVFVVGILLGSIWQRRQEAVPPKPLQAIDYWETDSARWAVNFPRQYERYRRMLDASTHTKYGGSYPRDYLEESPINVILFAGMGFAKDYRQARGHIYSVKDLTETLRLTPKSSAACWVCKTPDCLPVMEKLGLEQFYAQPFSAFREQMTHPIGCRDCHDPQTMRLVITRPALREALERQGRNLDEISHQEMRTLVCAQCHVEYYFRGEGNYLTFPWDKGTSLEAVEAYYEELGFADWTHAISKTPMVKIQHPEYELYLTGIHAYRNVACADCHMPYISEGGVKYTDHHIQSPLLNVANSCAVCHRWTEAEIRARAESIQDKVHETRRRAEQAIALAHLDVAAAMQAGASDTDLKPIRQLIRQAGLRWDFVAAQNGMGFHSPAECLRLLAAAVDLAGQARQEAVRVLATRGVSRPITYPDFSTKAKAQALVQQFVDGQPPRLLP